LRSAGVVGGGRRCRRVASLPSGAIEGIVSGRACAMAWFVPANRAGEGRVSQRGGLAGMPLCLHWIFRLITSQTAPAGT
jgi:hypothetical protein